MDYENKHREEIARATQLWECGDITRENLEYIFPELCESDDEKIRNIIRGWIYTQPASFFDNGISKEEILAWLEKKDEQEEPQVYETEDGEIITYSENSGYKIVEPKFHNGDWIIFNGLILHINEIVQGYYRTTSINSIPNSYDWDIDNVARLWSIQDAKNGDVLSYMTDEEDLWIMIYWALYEPYEGHVHYHALLVNDNFSDKGTCCICINDLKPATKEQRDLLFQKMKDAGYEWDAEKKELKMLEKQGKSM